MDWITEDWTDRRGQMDWITEDWTDRRCEKKEKDRGT